VLRAKRSLGWRTVLVVPELDSEVAVRRAHALMRDAIRAQRDELLELEQDLAALELELFPAVGAANAAGHELARAADADADARVAALIESLESAKAELADRVRAYHKKFHGQWGQLFKTGYQNSRFAQQVENYACLYTARATNLGAYSPQYRFHTVVDVMPHDRS
jgi:hypothetical protein